MTARSIRFRWFLDGCKPLTDDPRLGKGNLEEEDLLDTSVKLDDTAVREEHCTPDDPGPGSEHQA